MTEEYQIGGISSIFSSGSKKRKPKAIAVANSNNDSEVTNTLVLPEVHDVIIKKKPRIETETITEEKAEGGTRSRKKLAAKRNTEKIAVDKERTVFIGNVPSDTPDRKMKTLFREFGDIEAIYSRSLLQKNEKLTLKMKHTDETIESHLTTKHFYVRFANKKQAEEAAVKMNGHNFNEHTLRVSMAGQNELTGAKTIFVGNLPFTAQDQDVIDFFRERCGAVKAVRLIRNRVTGKTTGIGYVAFEDYDSVVKALELSEVDFSGRPLRISKSLSQHKRPAGTQRFAQTSFRQIANGRHKPKTAHNEANRKKQLAEVAAERIAKFSTFKKEEVLEKSGSKSGKTKSGSKGGLSKNVRKIIKKRKGGKTKSIMT